MRTLILNNDYSVLGVVKWEKAVTLYFLNKIEIIEEFKCPVRSANLEMKMPAVIRILRRVRSKKVNVRFNKRSIYSRDRGMCQYCRKSITLHQATFDHVTPKSRGGQTTWNNITTACSSCNEIKNDRTPEEAGMALTRAPCRP